MSAANQTLEARKERLRLSIRDTLTAKRNAEKMAKQCVGTEIGLKWETAAKQHAARITFLSKELRETKAQGTNPREEFAPLFFDGQKRRR